MWNKIVLVLILCLPGIANAETTVANIDLLGAHGLQVNAAGPVLVQMDVERNRILVANTLSSSFSIIDGETHAVTNIPLGGRALQHLKGEAMVYARGTGDVYLVGTKCFYIISPASKSSRTIRTGVQLASIAVDENTGNVFVAGRESKAMVFYEARKEKLRYRDWLNHEEEMINLNQTPPPPLRKVVSDNELGKIVAVDGFTSTLYLFDPKDGAQLDSRPLPLTGGGRWHLAGYNETTHCLYIVTETSRRRVIEAARIDVTRGQDVVVKLPELTEGVGINYNPTRDEIYVPYDNHQTVHVVSFENGGAWEKIAIPTFGNDASAIDVEGSLLYVASWAHGEIDVVDLEARKLQKRITNLGIIPHMFTMTFNPHRKLLYYPKGATAVNGTFGSAVTVLDPARESTEKVRLGWAPIDLVALENRSSVLVFNSEDQFAEVWADGRYDLHDLPFDYPVDAARSPDGNVYLSYGPHQSYWPTVYIWGAKNGILTIDKDDLHTYDRRIPRQAHKLVLDGNGVLYFPQNNWGSEVQFIGTLEDEVRLYDPGRRIALGDTVTREITQRILEYDEALHRLYLVRVGEDDSDPSVLQVVHPDSQRVDRRLELGLVATDLAFDDENIYVSNFGSDHVSVIDKRTYAVREISTGPAPLRLCQSGERVFVLNHGDNTLQQLGENGAIHKIPKKGWPDNIFAWRGRMVVTSHNAGSLFVIAFDPAKGSFRLLHEEDYPYGDTRFDTNNVSFYTSGQFGDAVFEITRGEVDSEGRLWLADFLSGKVFVFEDR